MVAAPVNPWNSGKEERRLEALARDEAPPAALKALAAAARSDDQAVLGQAAQSDFDDQIRRTAMARLENQVALAQVAI
jgi:hypothetical protein